MLDAVARHGGLDLDVRGAGRPRDGRPPHGRGRRAWSSGRRSTRRSATAPGSRRYGQATVPMDEARATCAHRHIRTRPLRVRGRAARRRRPIEAAFDSDLAEEFFRAVADAAKLTLHVRIEAGTNAHHMVEAAFKAFARALRQAVGDRPGRRPASRPPRGCCERRRIWRCSTTAWATCARSRRRSSARERERRGHRSAAEAGRAQGLVLPGVGAFPKAMEAVRRLGFASSCCERASAGRPVLGICLGMQLLFDSSAELGGAEGIGVLEGDVERARRAGPEGSADRLERGRAGASPRALVEALPDPLSALPRPLVRPAAGGRRGRAWDGELRRASS